MGVARNARRHMSDVHRSDREDDKEGDRWDVCAICFDPNTPATSLVLRCAHVFHRACVARMRERAWRCPMCRAPARIITRTSTSRALRAARAHARGAAKLARDRIAQNETLTSARDAATRARVRSRTIAAAIAVAGARVALSVMSQEAVTIGLGATFALALAYATAVRRLAFLW